MEHRVVDIDATRAKALRRRAWATGRRRESIRADLTITASAPAPTPRVLVSELAQCLELGGVEVGVRIGGGNHGAFAGDVGVDAEEQSGFDLAVETGLGTHPARRSEHDHEQPDRRDSGDDSCKKRCHSGQSYPRPSRSLA